MFVLFLLNPENDVFQRFCSFNKIPKVHFKPFHTLDARATGLHFLTLLDLKPALRLVTETTNNIVSKG